MVSESISLVKLLGVFNGERECPDRFLNCTNMGAPDQIDRHLQWQRDRSQGVREGKWNSWVMRIAI
jgi:hypothetical protein